MGLEDGDGDIKQHGRVPKVDGKCISVVDSFRVSSPLLTITI
jgi:hypothetical protein